MGSGGCAATALSVAGLALAGCGRIDFGLAGDAGAGGTVADALATSTDPTLILWLQMNTDSTGGFLDTSMYRNPVTCFDGACPTQAPGEDGLGADFAAPAALAASPIAADTAFTVAAWIELHAYSVGNACVASRPTVSTVPDSFSLCVMPSGQALYFTGNGVPDTDSLVGSIVSLNTWHHLVMRWDGAVKTGFLDGANVGSDNTPVLFENPVTLVGATLDSGGNPTSAVDGVIDDVRIYSRALEDAEVTALDPP